MKKRHEENAHPVIFAAAAVLGVSVLLFAVMLDGSRYGEETVSAAITYTEPERSERVGIWELFSDSLYGLFMPEG